MYALLKEADTKRLFAPLLMGTDISETMQEIVELPHYADLDALEKVVLGKEIMSAVMTAAERLKLFRSSLSDQCNQASEAAQKWFVAYGTPLLKT